ncbi:uncharacterized protein PAC_14911 [Phialocephala subalpina]|uniref:DUF6603 domain-containing protein n=1 Tax=Phialocephala subalpina TaxID=576137 RepID=A0A1L7XJ07_9HELO|nr:uncharacterized protein PAC_14911 [Phialocephala subalpina]
MSTTKEDAPNSNPTLDPTSIPTAADFLVQTQMGTPATISTDPNWTQVLSDAKVVPGLVSQSSDGDNDVIFTASTDLWGLQFSSTNNQSYFGNALTPEKLLNHAWIGDNFNSGVVALSSTQPGGSNIFSTDIPLQGKPLNSDGSVWKAFNITADNPQLMDLVKILDPDNSLTVKLQAPVNPNPNASALWFVTTPDYYQTTVQLVFVLNPLQVYEKAIQWINTNLGFNITLPSNQLDILLTAKKSTIYDVLNLTNTTEQWALSLLLSIQDFDFAFDFSAMDTSFYLIPTQGTATIVSSLATACGNTLGMDTSEMPTTNESDLFTKLIGDHLDLWYVKVDKDFSNADSPLTWAVGVLASWNGGASNNPIIVGLSYNTTTKKFKGRLITSTDRVLTNRRYPNYDYRLALPSAILSSQLNIDVTNLPSSISLWDIFASECGSPPSVLRKIPFALASAMLSYSSPKGSKTFTFSTTIVRDLSPQPTPEETEAPSGFLWNQITVFASRTWSGTARKTNFKIYSEIELASKDTSIPAAYLDVALAYENSPTTGSDWTFNASISNLSVHLLAETFFDFNSNQGAMAILGNLTVNSLDLSYTYSSGKSTSFLISATLILSELELDLSYQYVSSLHPQGESTAADLKWNGKPPHKEISKITPNSTTIWKFEAFLSVKDNSSNIAQIVNSIAPGEGDALPGFVGDIVVAAKGDPLSAPIKLIYTGGNDNGSTLAVWVNIGVFNLTFVYYRSAATNGKTAMIKRFLRMSVDQIPTLTSKIHLPLINELPQPFDSLLFLWVGDEGTTTQSTQGIIRYMIEPAEDRPNAINTTLADIDIPPIQWKELSGKPNPDDQVLQPGYHFMVITNNKAVLDHVFGQTTTPTAELAQPHSNVHTTADPAPEQDPPATKGDCIAKVGPLTVAGLSLQYKNSSLFIGIDATLVLGPLTFSVVGFTIEIDMGSPDFRLNNLSGILTHLPPLVSVSIHGLDASVEKPPLTIGGAFVHDTTDVPASGTSIESYRGGVAVGLEAWQVIAVGEYAIVTQTSTGSSYKSVFVYGELNGPLIQLEAVTISGVRLGFGYNSLVRLPAASELYSFPFISNNAGGGDPLAIINALETGPAPFVYKKEGGCFFTAGMTITCCDCISLTAALMFEISTSSQPGIVIALLADGVFQMEPLAPADATLIYVELLIKVEVNFTEGYIAADAALAPTSHIYVPQAHLTGMGAFYSWFPPSSHAGDWVFTLGGYHRAYQPPSWYPQNLTMIGLDFVVGNSIASTPYGLKAADGINASVACYGRVLWCYDTKMCYGRSAYADITLDVFINFKPFYFIAEMRLSVGVDCDIGQCPALTLMYLTSHTIADLLIVSFHIHISLGADLTLWGPDSFGGTAYVNFWFFGFSVDFGSGLRDPPPATLLEFYDMVRTNGPSGNSSTADSAQGIDPVNNPNPFDAQHKCSVESGLFPQKPQSLDPTKFPNTGSATEWIVLAGSLQIRIDCNFSLSAAWLVNDETTPSGAPSTQPSTTSSTTPITTNPLTALNPIYSFPMHNTDPITSELSIRIYFYEGAETKLIPGWQAELVIKPAPMATWSQYTSDNDPLHRIAGGGLNQPTNLQSGDNPTVDLCQGVRLFPPAPYLSKSPVVDFDATSAMVVVEEYHLYDYVKFDPEQTTYQSTPFEPADDAPTQWANFGKVWTGLIDGSTQDDAGEIVAKSELRGDGQIGSGVMGLLVTTLGWDQRSPAETVKGEVPPAPAGQRLEWQLQSSPPSILAGELEYYYPYLPMTAVAAAA